MKKLILHFSLLLLPVSTILLGCKDKEEVPPSPIPQIEFKEVKLVPSSYKNKRYDSLIITISYTDGDGDLGLNYDKDTAQIFQYYNKDGSLNDYYFNYYLKMYIEDNGVYKLIGNDERALYAIFPRISGANSIIDIMPFFIKVESKWHGEIIIKRGVSVGFDALLKKGKNAKFELQIIDRALHKSNVVPTEILL